MKRKKIIQKVLWSVGASVVLFFYFWGLSYWGEDYRAQRKGNRDSEKTDTVLVEGWKFHSGDITEGASQDLSDNAWTTVKTDSLPDSFKGEVAWFRLHVLVDSVFLNKPVALAMHHYGASEIYLDGLHIASFGKVGDKKNSEENMDPEVFPVNIHLSTPAHLIAVRYSNLHAAEYKKIFGTDLAGFQLRLMDEATCREEIFQGRVAMMGGCLIGVFLLTLSFVHFLLFLFYRRSKENLFYSLFAFSYSMIFFIATIQAGALVTPWIELLGNNLIVILVPVVLISLLRFVQMVYKSHFPVWLWISTLAIGFLIILDGITNWVHPTIAFSSIMWLVIFCVISMVTGTYKAIRKKITGAKILGAGIGTFALFIFFILSLTFYSRHINVSNIWIVLVIVAAMLSIPISMSVYLAYSFSSTNRNLSRKLIEVEQLSVRSIAQEKEKQDILSRQKETLEVQVKERTKEVVQQKKVIEEKNKDITDSINYAKRIQDAILPSEEQIKKMLPDSFVLYKPKDIVSGDFYFFSEVNSRVVVAAADCTGHGVPGAVMSMVGHNHLKRIVSEQGITDTSKILDELHKQVLLSLNRDISKRDSKDGMDVSIVSINKQKREVQFSGAVRPLYYFDRGGFHEVKGERYSIAGVKEIGSAPYASTNIPLLDPTTFYLFSDGFADQFGGKDGKKLMSKNFRELLHSIQNRSMSQQKDFLENFIEEWRSGREQMDDIMVIGFRL